MLTNCTAPSALLFTLAGLGQMTQWAFGKHRNYRKEFEKYPRGRKAIIPFVLWTIYIFVHVQNYFLYTKVYFELFDIKMSSVDRVISNTFSHWYFWMMPTLITQSGSVCFSYPEAESWPRVISSPLVVCHCMDSLNLNINITPCVRVCAKLGWSDWVVCVCWRGWNKRMKIARIVFLTRVLGNHLSYFHNALCIIMTWMVAGIIN